MVVAVVDMYSVVAVTSAVVVGVVTWHPSKFPNRYASIAKLITEAVAAHCPSPAKYAVPAAKKQPTLPKRSPEPSRVNVFKTSKKEGTMSMHDVEAGTTSPLPLNDRNSPEQDTAFAEWPHSPSTLFSAAASSSQRVLLNKCTFGTFSTHDTLA